MKEIWNNAHLLPHTRNNKTLKPEECYDAAKDGDHTLYFMVPSPQTEVEKDSERTLLLLPPLLDSPILQDHFAVPQKIVKRTRKKLVRRVSNHGKLKASLQTRVEGEVERSTSTRPIPQPPNFPL